ncbi:hypothetical protein NP493_7559g00000 [Ridgeia piscesae]|uniref:Uncharacterized protein n=1 Tax=Ridgeia piscesae TaxID=27915 RepID=A0AAD9IPW7_RIDPI|nr:hypothetical protein NP493_7559g00000 [Ridgeia piscesae]
MWLSHTSRLTKPLVTAAKAVLEYIGHALVVPENGAPSTIRTRTWDSAARSCQCPSESDMARSSLTTPMVNICDRHGNTPVAIAFMLCQNRSMLHCLQGASVNPQVQRIQLGYGETV